MTARRSCGRPSASSSARDALEARPHAEGRQRLEVALPRRRAPLTARPVSRRRSAASRAASSSRSATYAGELLALLGHDGLGRAAHEALVGELRLAALRPRPRPWRAAARGGRSPRPCRRRPPPRAGRRARARRSRPPRARRRSAPRCAPGRGWRRRTARSARAPPPCPSLDEHGVEHLAGRHLGLGAEAAQRVDRRLQRRRRRPRRRARAAPRRARGCSCSSSGAAPYCAAISSVTNGRKGCSRRTIWSRIQRACPAACAFCTSSSPYRRTLTSSRYQSQNSSQTKW